MSVFLIVALSHLNHPPTAESLSRSCIADVQPLHTIAGVHSFMSSPELAPQLVVAKCMGASHAQRKYVIIS